MQRPANVRLRRALVRVPAALLAAVLALGLGWAVLSLPEPATGLTGRVDAELPNSGVSHPVTAVLLNFRGYDTLLEIGVLLLALLCVWSLRLSPARRDPEAARTPVLGYLVRLLVPVVLVVTVYLLWAGSKQPGGAFQAGAVLAAAGGTSTPGRLYKGTFSARLAAAVGAGRRLWHFSGGSRRGHVLWKRPAGVSAGLRLRLDPAHRRRPDRLYRLYPGGAVFRIAPGSRLGAESGGRGVSQVTLYALSGVAIVAVCLYGLISYPHLVRKVLAINVLGSGIFLILLSFARRVPGAEPDPVPHAMALTGIVVSVCATAFALALARRVYDETNRPYLPEEEETPEEDR